ncbi:hypothetical protein TSAR_014980, partial [Trichomalopsis sarcophagae]
MTKKFSTRLMKHGYLLYSLINYDHISHAIAMGLIENDKEIFNAFDEACLTMFPYQLRSYFAWYLIINKLSLAKIIWEKYKIKFCEDFIKKFDNKNLSDRNKMSASENLALCEIEKILNFENYKCSEFGLPQPNTTVIENLTNEDCQNYK